MTGIILFIILCLNILGNINYTVCIKKDTVYGAFSSAVNDKTRDLGCVNNLYHCTTNVVATISATTITSKTIHPKTISITATATPAMIIASSTNANTTTTNKLLLLSCYNMLRCSY